MNELIDENLLVKRSYLPQPSSQTFCDTDFHGKDGYVRIHNHFDWFRNYVAIQDRLYMGSLEYFNRGSLIDYLNAKSEGTGKAKLSKGFFGWIWGSSQEEILNRYHEILQDSTKPTQKILWQEGGLLIPYDDKKNQVSLITRKNSNVFESLEKASSSNEDLKKYLTSAKKVYLVEIPSSLEERSEGVVAPHFSVPKKKKDTRSVYEQVKAWYKSNKTDGEVEFVMRSLANEKNE